MSQKVRIKLLIAGACVLLASRLFGDDLPEPTSQPSREIFCLDRAEPASYPVEPSPLERELFRQALLIAARDELGMDTRDASLGEEFPADVGDNDDRRATISVLFESKDRPQVLQVDCAGGHGSTLSISADIPRFAHDLPDLGKLVDQTEELSRGKFVDWLRERGLGGSPNAVGIPGSITNEEEQRLDEMSIISQFEAIRVAHLAIREHGESPAWMSALIRGYANLGQLTRFEWTSAPEVFTARSLLYARRFLEANPDSPEALRASAYAEAMAGLQADALADLQRLPLDAPPGEAWANFILPFCQYDTSRLLRLQARDAHNAGLAMFMAFLTMENCGSPACVIEMGRSTLQANPLCERVLDAVADNAGDSYLDALTQTGLSMPVDALRVGLQELTRLPNNVIDAWNKAHDNADLMQDLSDLNQSLVDAPDVADPSWQVLGRLLQQADFVHAYRRIYFEAYDLDVDPSDTIQQLNPLVVGQPLALIVASIYTSSARQPLPDGMDKMYLGDFSFRMPDNMSVRKLLQWEGRDTSLIWQLQLSHIDPVAWDLESGLIAGSDSRVEITSAPSRAALLRFVSPYSPVGVAGLIKYDWNHLTPDQIAQWQTQYGDDPAFDLAISKHYLDAGQRDRAVESLENLVQIAPDRTSFEDLANCYLADGDENRWLATMERALTQEDYAQDHAEEDDEIADHFMSQGKFDRALPYADDGVNSGEEWALDCAARCHTAMGQFDAAEMLMKQAADRRGRPFLWYAWCRATDHGDIATARLAMQQSIGSKAEDPTYTAAFLVAEGKPDQAATMLDQDFESTSDPSRAVWAAILDDGLDNTARRNELLRLTQARSKAFADQHQNSEYLDFAQLLQSAILQRNGVFDPQAVNQDLSWVTPARRAPLNYLSAEYLIHHGKADEGVELLKQAARDADENSATGRLAFIELHDRGINPYTLVQEPGQ
jgi:tetratricopeptide (TPR) repeat protein